MTVVEEYLRTVENLTVPRLILRNAVEHGDRSALTTMGAEPATLTWAELRQRSA